MSERATKKITTASGTEAVIYTYLTGRERNALRDVYMSHVSISGDGQPQSFSALVVSKAEEKLMEMCLVSYGALKGKEAVEAVYNAPSAELDSIVAELSKLDQGFLAKK